MGRFIIGEWHSPLLLTSPRLRRGDCIYRLYRALEKRTKRVTVQADRPSGGGSGAESLRKGLISFPAYRNLRFGFDVSPASVAGKQDLQFT
jgi:hypothetical protein